MFDLLERFFAKFAKRSNNKGFSVITLLFWMNSDKLWTIGQFVGHQTAPLFMFIPNDLLLFSCLLIRMFLITVKGSEWDSKHFHTNHPNVETRDTRHLNLMKPSMSGKYLLPHQATTPSDHTKRPHQATTPSFHTKLPRLATIPSYHAKLPHQATTPRDLTKLPYQLPYFRCDTFFSSMNWPNRYLAGTDCNWNIEAPIGHQLVVDIDMFDIGGVKNKCDNIYASVTGKIFWFGSGPSDQYRSVDPWY